MVAMFMEQASKRARKSRASSHCGKNEHKGSERRGVSEPAPARAAFHAQVESAGCSSTCDPVKRHRGSGGMHVYKNQHEYKNHQQVETGRDFDLPRHFHYSGVIPMVFQHSVEFKHNVKEIFASPLLVCIIKQLSGGRMQYLRARRGGALDDAAA